MRGCEESVNHGQRIYQETSLCLPVLHQKMLCALNPDQHFTFMFGMLILLYITCRSQLTMICLMIDVRQIQVPSGVFAFLNFAQIIMAQEEKSHCKFRLTYCLRSCIIRTTLVEILDRNVSKNARAHIQSIKYLSPF